MLTLGSELSQRLTAPCVIFLRGQLGAGKTTLVRGFLRGLGYQGNVKSPTYTLVEDYRFGSFNCYHFDLYRLTEPEEIESIGIRDYLDTEAICLIEWPEKAEGCLPSADLQIRIEVQQKGRRVCFELSNTYSDVLKEIDAS